MRSRVRYAPEVRRLDDFPIVDLVLAAAAVWFFAELEPVFDQMGNILQNEGVEANFAATAASGEKAGSRERLAGSRANDLTNANGVANLRLWETGWGFWPRSAHD